MTIPAYCGAERKGPFFPGVRVLSVLGAEVKEKLMVSRANINNTKTISFTLYTYGKRGE